MGPSFEEIGLLMATNYMIINNGVQPVYSKLKSLQGKN